MEMQYSAQKLINCSLVVVMDDDQSCGPLMLTVGICLEPTLALQAAGLYTHTHFCLQ